MVSLARCGVACPDANVVPNDSFIFPETKKYYSYIKLRKLEKEIINSQTTIKYKRNNEIKLSGSLVVFCYRITNRQNKHSIVIISLFDWQI